MNKMNSGTDYLVSNLIDSFYSSINLTTFLLFKKVNNNNVFTRNVVKIKENKMNENELSLLKDSVEYTTEDNLKISGLSCINENDEHFLIYKMVNLINGMYYIGKHKTRNPLDEYSGSGLFIGNAKQKYGIENFIKILMYDFNTEEEMEQKEIELVPEISCYHSNPMCYNIAAGGQGGNLGKEVNRRISNAISGEKNGMYGKKLSKESLQKISDKLKGHPNYTHKGWKQTEEAKRKISIHNKGKKHTEAALEKIRLVRKNQKNLKLDSAKGKHWYFNPITNEETMFFESEVPIGWIKGRLENPTKGTKKYYTNGIKDILIDENAIPPNGFMPGRKKHGEYSFERNKKISLKLKGRKTSLETKEKLRLANLGKRWYNNGIIQVLSKECPKGFKLGKLK